MNNKDTIYIDIDDEITTIIDKLRVSDQKIIALVLPKRATVLQSIVNMKLLKRAADQEGKRPVLITAEAGLLPLAGTVGLYVAKTLQTKPEIPTVGLPTIDDDKVIDESLDAEEITASTAGNRSVGELAGAGAVAASPAAADAIETVELDDDSPAIASTAATDKTDTAAKPAKSKRDKKLGVPNFHRFRLVLILGGVFLVLLIGGGIVAATVLPKASIVVHTDTTTVDSNLAITVDTATKTLNTDKLVIPATVQKVDKTGSQQIAASGKKNNGNKASGSISMNAGACGANVPSDVPSGTGVTASGLTFVTQDDATFSPVVSHGKCTFQSQNAVNIIAQAGGASYNLGPTSFTVAGQPGVSASSSSALGGGTDNIIQVVAQADIDAATQKITAQNSDAVKQQLDQQSKQASLYPLDATFAPGSPNTTSSAQVGDQVSTVTVTQTTTYTMFSVKESDLKTLVDADIKDKIDPSKQSIQSEGLDKATFKVNNITATSAGLAMATTAVAGPDLQADSVKQQIAGKKSGQVQDTLKANPGVTSVDVHLSPFWVTSVPSKANRVTVTFDKTQ